MPPDDELEEMDISELIAEPAAPGEFDDVPTVVELRHLCPGCADDSMRLDDSVQPPASHAEAWRRGCCYGNSIFFWCKGVHERKGEGRLTMVGSMEVFFFPDRRLAPR